MKPASYFEVKDGKIRFITLDRNGDKVIYNLWELVNKFGADQVLKMRTTLPEIKK